MSSVMRGMAAAVALLAAGPATILAAGAAAVLAQAPPTTWVAVADDGQRNFGIVAGMATREAAEIAALGECGNDCRIRLAAPARCVAYAHSDNGQASGYGAGATVEHARQSAWNECNARVPSNSCTLRGSRCFE